MKELCLLVVITSFVVIFIDAENIHATISITEPEESRYNIKVGSDVRVTCELKWHIEYGNLSVVRDDTKVVWTPYPSSKGSQSLPHNLNVDDDSDDWSKSGHKSVSLLFANVQKEHEGIYQCSAQLATSRFTSGREPITSVIAMYETYDLRVHTNEEAQIYLWMNDTFAEVEEGNTAVWNGVVKGTKIIEFDGKDYPFNLNEPDANGAFSIEMENTQIDYPSHFTISALMKSDDGKGVTRKNIGLELAVKSTMSQLRPIENKYLVGVKADITCEYEGIGKRTIELSFQDCFDEDHCWPDPEIEAVSVDQSRHPISFMMKGWKAETSVMFRCKSYETPESSNVTLSQERACVTDTAGAIEIGPIQKINIDEKPENVTSVYKGDDIKLTCRSTFCSPSSAALHVEWFFRDPTTSEPEETLTNDYTTGVASIQAEIIVRNITRSGIYLCKRNDEESQEVEINVLTGDGTILTSIYIVVFLLIAGLLALITLCLRRRRQYNRQRNMQALQDFQKGDVHALQKDLPLYAQADLLPFDKQWEFPREKLTLGKTLGSGFFGMVLEAEADGLMGNDEKTIVAVKTVKRHADAEVVRALEKELKIMSNLGSHPHIVNLLGAVVDRLAEKELMLLVEYCSHGSLLNYLKLNRYRYVNLLNATTGKIETKSPETSRGPGYQNKIEECVALLEDPLPFDTNVLMQWSYQIARGMEFLASKKILHCDLAARNVLLCADNLIKICDFGLAHDLYTKEEYIKKRSAKLPAKWLAIESLEDRVFSTQSDVWSFGVVLWEIFTIGRAPYANFESFQEIFNALRGGYRMEKPEFAPDVIYTITRNCWKADPKLRPNFGELSNKLLGQLEEGTRAYYLKLEGEYAGPMHTPGLAYMPMTGKVNKNIIAKRARQIYKLTNRVSYGLFSKGKKCKPLEIDTDPDVTGTKISNSEGYMDMGLEKGKELVNMSAPKTGYEDMSGDAVKNANNQKPGSRITGYEDMGQSIVAVELNNYEISSPKKNKSRLSKAYSPPQTDDHGYLKMDGDTESKEGDGLGVHKRKNSKGTEEYSEPYSRKELSVSFAQIPESPQYSVPNSPLEKTSSGKNFEIKSYAENKAYVLGSDLKANGSSKKSEEMSATKERKPSQSSGKSVEIKSFVENKGYVVGSDFKSHTKGSPMGKPTRKDSADGGSSDDYYLEPLGCDTKFYLDVTPDSPKALNAEEQSKAAIKKAEKERKPSQSSNKSVEIKSFVENRGYVVGSDFQSHAKGSPTGKASANVEPSDDYYLDPLGCDTKFYVDVTPDSPKEIKGADPKAKTQAQTEGLNAAGTHKKSGSMINNVNSSSYVDLQCEVPVSVKPEEAKKADYMGKKSTPNMTKKKKVLATAM